MTPSKDSTSGGVFTALADYILESGGVVFGAAFDGKQHLRHIACFRKEELWRLRGAKYVQSDLGETFRTVKRLWRPARCSSPAPCQVDGLYRFLGGRPEEPHYLRSRLPRRPVPRRVGGYGPLH